jgi:hypothetical protein
METSREMLSELSQPTRALRAAIPDRAASPITRGPNGGTASVDGPRAWAAFHEFATDRTKERL